MKHERVAYKAGIAAIFLLSVMAGVGALVVGIEWAVAILVPVPILMVLVQHLNHRAVARQHQKTLVAVRGVSSGLTQYREEMGQAHADGAHAQRALMMVANDLVRRSKIYHKALSGDISNVRSDLKVRSEQIPGESVDLWRASVRLAPDLADIPMPGGWAVTVPTLTAMLNEIGKNSRRRTIVECGSGTSTIWLGLALRHRGHGHVYALEHQERFAEATRAYVLANGLEDWVTILEAPLVHYSIEGNDYRWYDLAAIGPIKDRIDLLFVDGPPASTGHMARYPAIPLLADRLADNAWVVLDDTVREEEVSIVSNWLAESHGGRRLIQERMLPKSVILAVAPET